MENFLTLFLYPLCAMLSTVALFAIALELENIRKKNVKLSQVAKLVDACLKFMINTSIQ